MTTKMMSKNSKSYKKTHRGCASEEPDEGNLQVRFCEGAYSKILGLLPQQKVGYGLYSTDQSNLGFQNLSTSLVFSSE